MSTRKADMRGEKALSLFLDKYFYSEIERKRIISSSTRIYEVSNQKRGVDIELVVESEIVKVDEKAQLYYIEKPVESFVLEVNFVKPETGHLTDGWFISNSNITDSYLFIWITKADTKLIHRITSEDFSEVDVYLVNKSKIKEYLKKHGFEDNNVREFAQLIRSDESIARNIGGDGFHFSYTRDIEEIPINIVMEKRILKTLSSLRYHISKEGITEI